MMQAPINRDNPTQIREKKEKKKHIPFNKERMNPDPNFIDERRVEKEKKSGFFEKLFGI